MFGEVAEKSEIKKNEIQESVLSEKGRVQIISVLFMNTDYFLI